MKIVIDIPDKVYEMVKMFGWEDREREWEIAFDKAIEYSIVLPKGHGRLIDADALFDEYEKTGWFDNADRDDIAEKILLDAPTIIEADEEGAEE